MGVHLSLAQMKVELGKPHVNFQKAAGFTRDAASTGSKLILLPELWSTGYDLENAHEHAHTNLGILEELKSLALEYQICIGGSLLLQEPGGIYNSFVLVNNDGQELQRYNKVHLFRLMQEEQFLQPGQHAQIAQTPFGAAGMAVCYDLRFPEFFRHYALNGAQIILLPAEWPARRQEHWNILLRARAIENQMFVAGVNTTGEIGAESFSGGSAVISPWGEVLAYAGEEETLLHAEIDPAQVQAVRERIPIFQDRRPEIYDLGDG